MGWERFTWRGEPIYNIQEWATKRGERMVKYRLTKQTVYGPEISEGHMPESFWNSLLIMGNESYEEL